MAIHCGVCGIRLSAAYENFGSFQTCDDFKGWCRDPLNGRAVIADTCDYCGSVLRRAVTDVANKMVVKCSSIVGLRQRQLEEHRARQKTVEQEENEFRRAWEAERARRVAGNK